MKHPRILPPESLFLSNYFRFTRISIPTFRFYNVHKTPHLQMTQHFQTTEQIYNELQQVHPARWQQLNEEINQKIGEINTAIGGVQDVCRQLHQGLVVVENSLRDLHGSYVIPITGSYGMRTHNLSRQQLLPMRLHNASARTKTPLRYPPGAPINALPPTRSAFLDLTGKCSSTLGERGHC